MGKPPFTVIGSAATPVQPPRPLGQYGKNLWDRIQKDYAITDTGGIELLAQMCQAVDRAEELAERIAADGAVLQTRSGPRSHPSIRDELACRAFICRTIQRLGLNLEPLQSRPSWKPVA